MGVIPVGDNDAYNCQKQRDQMLGSLCDAFYGQIDQNVVQPTDQRQTYK